MVHGLTEVYLTDKDDVYDSEIVAIVQLPVQAGGAGTQCWHKTRWCPGGQMITPVLA